MLEQHELGGSSEWSENRSELVLNTIRVPGGVLGPQSESGSAFDIRCGHGWRGDDCTQRHGNSHERHRSRHLTRVVFHGRHGYAHRWVVFERGHRVRVRMQEP